MFKDKTANLVANGKAKKGKFSINMILAFTTRNKVPKNVAFKDKEPLKTKFLPFNSNIVKTQNLTLVIHKLPNHLLPKLQMKEMCQSMRLGSSLWKASSLQPWDNFSIFFQTSKSMFFPYFLPHKFLNFSILILL
jgi:hypothetical protein